MTPDLSIIIPMYNMAAMVERTLRSLDVIAPERRAAVEVIVVDDGSTDDSPAIARRQAAMLPDFRWQFHAQPNAGANSARNRAILAAQGEWLFFLDADDELLIDLTALLADAGDATCFAMTLEYHGSNIHRHVRPPRCSARQLYWNVFSSRNPYPMGSLLLRRDATDRLFSQTIRTCEDWLFLMENPRIFERMIVRRDIVSTRIHVHGGNTSRHYAKMGQGRAAVARQILTTRRSELSTRQRNNFLLQEQIGLMQSGQLFNWRCFFRWPCSLALLGKAMVYLAARLANLRATRY